MRFDLGQVDELLSTTRAVRKRLDLERPVPGDVVLDCIRLATQAPSGGNEQRWRWVVVTDASTRAAIAEHYQRAYAAYMAARLEQLAPDDVVRRRMTDSSTHLADRLADVPMLVIPCVLDVLPATASRREQASFWGSMLPAVWSFQLALRSRGLGSAWTTLHLEHEREVADILGIPETVTQVALLPVAYTIGTEFRPATRRAAESVTYLDRWRTPWERP